MLFDAVWTASLEPLTTRHEVRGFLSRRINELIVGQAQQDLLTELSSLATGSDGEVIESYRRLDMFCKRLSATDAKHIGMLVSLNVRDLFAQALQRMKQLPPDPRETLHAKAPKTPGFQQPGRARTTGRGVSHFVALRERTARIFVKPARWAHSPQLKA